MFEEIYRLPDDLVAQVEWQDDPLYYDYLLYQLGSDRDEFWILNPDSNLQSAWSTDLKYYIKEIPFSRKCLVFTYQGNWLAKVFRQGWYPYHGYETIEIKKPELIWNKNSDLDPSMTFEEDYFGNFDPTPWDIEYKLVWYLDPRFNPLDDKVWAFSCQPLGKAVKGIKDMGYVTPQVDVEFNPHLPNLLINVDDCVPAFYDIAHECAYELDSMHGSDEQLWVIKFTPRWRKPKEWKWLGAITPGYKVEYNPHLPDMTYNIDYVIPWHDLGFTHVWMLDRKHLQNGEEDIWAVKIICAEDADQIKIVGDVSPELTIKINSELKGYNFSIDDYSIPYHDFKFEQVWKLDHEYSNNEDIWAVKARAVSKTEGWKDVGYITPVGLIEYNLDLKNLRVNIDYTIPYYDRQYLHVWYLDKLDEHGNKIWAAKMATTVKPTGEKEMGIVVPEIPDDLDVIFISYNEPDAERNWKRVLEKAPWAKRVDGVKGIFQAHKAAARLATTDMFYVVDGDAYLLDTWNFNFQPSIFDRDCTYIWCSINPINDLVYGYGGVKLFSKKKLLSTRKWTKLDMSTTVSKKIKVMPETSNYTNFNTDDYSTWRSAFRECVKLSYQNDKESASRLKKWLTVGETRNYGITAIEAAEEAVAFTKKNMLKYEALLKINDDSWLEAQYRKYKGLK